MHAGERDVLDVDEVRHMLDAPDSGDELASVDGSSSDDDGEKADARYEGMVEEYLDRQYESYLQRRHARDAIKAEKQKRSRLAEAGIDGAAPLPPRPAPAAQRCDATRQLRTAAAASAVPRTGTGASPAPFLSLPGHCGCGSPCRIYSCMFHRHARFMAMHVSQRTAVTSGVYSHSRARCTRAGAGRQSLHDGSGVRCSRGGGAGRASGGALCAGRSNVLRTAAAASF